MNLNCFSPKTPFIISFFFLILGMNNKQIALLILLTLISTVQVFLVQFLVVDFL